MGAGCHGACGTRANTPVECPPVTTKHPTVPLSLTVDAPKPKDDVKIGVVQAEQGGVSCDSSMPAVADVPTPIMEQYMKCMFETADENGDGVLQSSELENLLNRSGFGFSKDVIQEMIAKADINSDGVISYEEFCPLVQSILNTPKPRKSESATVAEYHGPTEMSGSGDVQGDWTHDHYQFRVEACSVAFIGSTYFFPSELRVSGVTAGDGKVKFVLDFPSFKDSSSLWNLRCEGDTLIGEVFRSGHASPVEVKMQRMKAEDKLLAPNKDTDEVAGRLDRILKAEMACDGGKRPIPL